MRGITTTSSLNSSIEVPVKFLNGFFKFNVAKKQYFLSYWTPLSSLAEVLNDSEESPAGKATFQNKDRKPLSSATALGHGLLENKKISIKLPDKDDMIEIKWSESVDILKHYAANCANDCESLEVIQLIMVKIDLKSVSFIRI